MQQQYSYGSLRESVLEILNYALTVAFWGETLTWKNVGRRHPSGIIQRCRHFGHKHTASPEKKNRTNVIGGLQVSGSPHSLVESRCDTNVIPDVICDIFWEGDFLAAFEVWTPDITYVFDTIATIPCYVVQKLFRSWKMAKVRRFYGRWCINKVILSLCSAEQMDWWCVG